MLKIPDSQRIQNKIIADVININLLSLTLFITIHKIERVAHAMVYLSTLLKKTVC